MAQHPKIHQLLESAELEAFEEFARERRDRTVTQCHDWLLAKGYRVARSSVGRWFKAFKAEDAMRASAEVAKQVMAAVAQGKGAAEIADAANLTLAQTLFEQALKLQRTKKVETKELRTLSVALKNAVGTTRSVAQAIEEAKRRQVEAVAEAEKAAKAGGSGELVVQRIREVFGL
jgi:hypothetical protein